MKTGEKIRTLRKQHKLTQTELGERLGVKTNAVSKWECGRVEDIPAGKIKKMAQIFNVPISLLVDDSDPIPVEKPVKKNLMEEIYKEKEKGLRRMAAIEEAQRVKTKESAKARLNLYRVLHLSVSQNDKERENKEIAVKQYLSDKALCHIPEILLDERDDEVEQLLEVLKYLPENTNWALQDKLQLCSLLGNTDCLRKAVSYIIDLLENPKYREDITKLQ